MMEAGKLDKRIVLQRLLEPHDSQSGAKATWGDDTPAWASIETTGGGESQDADQTTATATHNLVIRWRSKLKEMQPGDWRVKIGDRVLGIEAASNRNEQNVFIDLACVEVRRSS